MIAGSVMHDEQRLCLDVVSQRFTFSLSIGENQLESWSKRSKSCEKASRERQRVGSIVVRRLSLFDRLSSLFPACVLVSTLAKV